jgi:hypothetical protein
VKRNPVCARGESRGRERGNLFMTNSPEKNR